jgi:hypothetical protein
LIESSECSSQYGQQYIELYNATDQVVDLNGLRIRNQDSLYYLTETTLVGPGEYGLGVMLVPAGCLELDADFFITDLSFDFATNNFFIENRNERIDEVLMLSWGMLYAPPMPGQGAGFQLLPGLELTGENEAEANWCVSQAPWSSNNTTPGTPGRANDGCAPPQVDTAVDDSDVDETDLLVDTGREPESIIEAYILGGAEVAPNVLFRGWERRVFSERAPDVVVPSFSEDLICAIRYESMGVSALDVSTTCPSCDWAFDVQKDNYMDERLLFFGSPSQCGSEFDVAGGAGSTVPDVGLAFSLYYGAMFYVTPSGSLDLMTYDVTYLNGFVEWKKSLYLEYTY